MEVNMEKRDTAKWMCNYRLSKYREDIGLNQGREEEFHKLFQPYEVVSGEGNCLLNSGIDEMWDLICGDSSNHFNNAGAQIGVGDSNTAANATPTALQAATNNNYQG